MYPHERSLVKRLAGKRFALLGVNSDEHREAVKKVVRQEGLGWRSWWDGGGTDGPIQTAYNVSHWPTLYVLDGGGMIRYFDVRGPKLDEAVDALLAELDRGQPVGEKGTAPAQPPSGYRAGFGRADITPRGPIRMAGYGSRNKPSEGVDAPLQVRALALHQGEGPPLLLVTADIIGFPHDLAEQIAGQVGKKWSLPRANILLVGSHTHTGPVIGRRKGMFALEGAEAEAVAKYADLLVSKAVAAAAQALEKAEPVRLSFGRGRATFAVNRRVFRPGGVDFGANPDGPVDHGVPVLCVEDPGGKVRAVVFGYACHCTTLEGNHYRIGGDWAGYAADFLERAHPGAAALFVTGCGGDANPQPRGRLDFARQHGLDMAGAVSRVLTGPRAAVRGRLRAVLERVDLPLANLPTPAELRKRLESRDAFVRRHARHFLDLLDRGEKLPTSYPCPVQVWRLGDGLTLVALGGEAVVDYALRLKRELKGGDVWVAAYANDVFAYVPSARVLLEGGYEADYNLIYYGLPGRFSGRVEEVLVGKVHSLVKQVR
jgi:hypothetical protein